MKLNQGTQNFWIQMGNSILFAIVATVISYFVAGWQAAIVAAVITIGLTVWFLVTVKSAVVRALPDEWEVLPARVEDFPNLDRTWLQQQTDALKQLGFQVLMDFKLVNSASSGFARCFSHPQHYCFLEISQCFPAAGEAISNFTLVSRFDRDWMLASANKPVSKDNSLSYLWRHPRDVVLFQERDKPSTALNAFFQSHLQFRQQMLLDLGLTLETDVSWDAYEKEQRQATVYRKQRLKQRNLLLGMIEVTRFELNPKAQWLGEYEKVRRKNHHSS